MQICCILLPVLILLITGIYFAYQYFQTPSYNTIEVFIDPSKIIFETEEKFLSVALDSSFMGCMFHHLNERDWKKFEELSKLLTPAYLRLGGTAADQTIFSHSENQKYVKNNVCVDIHPNKTIIISDKDWIKINQFAINSGFNFIVDLNVLLRSNSDWNSSNAKNLIDFSEENGFQLDFQLGNEPDSFFHVFNVEISGAQLARDFLTLREILNSSKAYRKSKLIGPDVTSRAKEKSLKYLKEFLKKDVVDVASWHHYYLNGRIATLKDFINPNTFNLFPPLVETFTKTVREFSSTLPIWLSETSTAFGGGAPSLSNRFAASFLWVDKLGVAAKSGISVVIRQTLFENHYALITDKFSPTPDFWISLLYKKLVGTRVLDLHHTDAHRDADYLRLYAHCLAPNSGISGNVVMYGINLKNQTELVDLPELEVKSPIHSFIFKAELNNLKAKSVLLNNNLLIYNEAEVPDLVKMSEEVEFPLVFGTLSIGFWVFKIEETTCGFP